jgi:hypothetical protein
MRRIVPSRIPARLVAKDKGLIALKEVMQDAVVAGLEALR